MVTWVNQVFNKSLSSKPSKIPFRDGKPWPRNLLPSCYLESRLFPKRHSLLQTETAWKDLCLTPEQRFLRSAAKPSTAPGKRSDTNIDILLLVRAHPRPPPWTPWRQDLPSRLLSHFKLRQVTSPVHQSGGYRTWHMGLLRHGHLVSQWTVRSPAEGVLYWASFVIHVLPISNTHTGVKEESCLSHLWSQSSALEVWLSRNRLGCDLRPGFPTTLRWYLWYLLPSNLMLCWSHQLTCMVLIWVPRHWR